MKPLEEHSRKQRSDMAVKLIKRRASDLLTSHEGALVLEILLQAVRDVMAASPTGGLNPGERASAIHHITSPESFAYVYSDALSPDYVVWLIREALLPDELEKVAI